MVLNVENLLWNFWHFLTTLYYSPTVTHGKNFDYDFCVYLQDAKIVFESFALFNCTLLSLFLLSLLTFGQKSTYLILYSFPENLTSDVTIPWQKYHLGYHGLLYRCVKKNHISTYQVPRGICNSHFDNESKFC